MRTNARGLLLLLAAALSVPAAAAELSGRVEVVSKGRSAPGEAGRAIVYFEPDRPPSHGARRSAPEVQEMVTERKEFSPRVLVVETDGAVSFPNRDPILHNVFSVSDVARFDLGLYGRGKAERVRFDEAGVVRVFCNVHHDMVGYVLVVDTPHHGRPDARGSFRLTGLPPGPGTLTVWHEQAEPWSRRIDVPASGTPSPVAARLEITKPRIPPHLDKSGRSYGARKRDRYRGH